MCDLTKYYRIYFVEFLSKMAEKTEKYRFTTCLYIPVPNGGAVVGIECIWEMSYCTEYG